MDSRGLDPTHLVGKIGYQGMRSYVTAPDPTLRSEEKLNESPASGQVRNTDAKREYSSVGGSDGLLSRRSKVQALLLPLCLGRLIG